MKKNLSEKDVDKIYETSPEGKAKIDQLEAALELLAKQKKNNITVPVDTEYVSFIMTGDWHMGSLYERLDVVDFIYKLAQTRNIKYILNAGDLLEGHGMYAGQEFEVHQHGWDKQKNWFLKHVPQVKGISMKFITGNHDESFEKKSGINVGQELCKTRDDFEFVGKCHGRVTFATPQGNLLVDMIHPDGGTAYALSYKPQRIIEQMEGGSKPHIVGIGHFHKAEVMPQYRNVCAIQVGTCQNQTPYMKRKPTSASVGFYVVEALLGKKKDQMNSFRTEFFSFY